MPSVKMPTPAELAKARLAWAEFREKKSNSYPWRPFEPVVRPAVPPPARARGGNPSFLLSNLQACPIIRSFVCILFHIRGSSNNDLLIWRVHIHLTHRRTCVTAAYRACGRYHFCTISLAACYGHGSKRPTRA